MLLFNPPTPFPVVSSGGGGPLFILNDWCWHNIKMVMFISNMHAIYDSNDIF